MDLKIAIQPDEVIHANGERQSFSDRWMEIASGQGVEAVPVDVFSHDIMEQIATCDAFMWRCDPSAHPRLYAKRLLYAVEHGLDVPVFPSLRTSWHFEDKVAQHYYFSSAGIPTPPTQIFWTRQQAERFCDAAEYPFVLKLASGYQATNVRLVRNQSDALYYVDQLFGSGVTNLGYRSASRARLLLRRFRATVEVIKGHNPCGPSPEAEVQYGYFYAQEYVPDNEFDVRVTIIGNRAFAFRRFNRPGDFRASGSGRIDWDSEAIDEDAIRLAYEIARIMRAQTVAVDILRSNSRPIIVELTLTYASWAVRDCPGHWILKGEPESGDIEWVQGTLRPEDAIIDDFITEVRHRQAARVARDK